ncbi:hypothetical protein DIPPA_24232 [Diplonema papillatum]|nr:hypothetical protein DIPPA_24232 [Diplonema papillatum]
MRPIFRGGTETMEVLETQLTTARVQRRGAGDGSFPDVRRWKGEACGEMDVFNDATEHERWSERVCPHQKVKCGV